MAFSIRKSLEKSLNFKWVNCKYQGIMVSRMAWIKVTTFLPSDYFDKLIYNTVTCKHIYFKETERKSKA